MRIILIVNPDTSFCQVPTRVGASANTSRSREVGKEGGCLGQLRGAESVRPRRPGGITAMRAMWGLEHWRPPVDFEPTTGGL